MLIGRILEKKVLEDALLSNESEFIAVYGRRRVGKTYLIREVYGGQFAFLHTGVANADKRTQIKRFVNSIEEFGLKVQKKPQDWFEAFDLLEQLLSAGKEGKKVVFLDELPWMDTKKSNFVSALEHFWNNWASMRTDIVLVVCGSATSWIINKILKNHGGLHNRVTQRIKLNPFTLRECEQYAQYRNLGMGRQQVLEAYMVLGGVPYYWKQLRAGMSTAQNIDLLFYGEMPFLGDEFEALYASLFRRPENYIAIVTALSQKGIGMTRAEILEATRLPDTNVFDRTLQELEECGFLRRYENYQMKKKNALYQLIDNYTLFYFRFLTKGRRRIEHFWTRSIQAGERTAWEGLAFERVCLTHAPQIKRALGIEGMLTQIYSWHTRGTDEYNGAQVDLVIDRADRLVNLCEMKYCMEEYTITKNDHLDIRNKCKAFALSTKTRKQIHTTFVTTYGVRHNDYWNMDVQSEVTMDDLFV